MIQQVSIAVSVVFITHLPQGATSCLHISTADLSLNHLFPVLYLSLSIHRTHPPLPVLQQY